MILKIANDNRSIIKKGVYLFSLVEYPKIQDWEWNNILAFISSRGVPPSNSPSTSTIMSGVDSMRMWLPLR